MKSDYLWQKFQIDSEPESLPHRGQVIRIVGAVRPGYLWVAKTRGGETFEVHSDWLRAFAKIVPKTRRAAKFP